MDGKQIREITAEGLTYLTEDGTESFVDFSVCYANYLRETTSPDYIEHMKKLNPQSRWDEEGIKDYIARRTAWREVARRNVIGQPWGDGRPYIDFHTEPPTRFEFASKAEFSKVLYAMQKSGWRTFDLS